ncbi:hypothetical protein TNCT_166651 [Trichonephila clavata]|uniref:Uncharacterized protein n=1 Tax=Trichonephila clavata TaxID=2740835 RepID=A0A8X6G8D3_TRICU|nr:hypothetical protein TNCT_166651 [Trichonephila clavata]
MITKVALKGGVLPETLEAKGGRTGGAGAILAGTKGASTTTLIAPSSSVQTGSQEDPDWAERPYEKLAETG